MAHGELRESVHVEGARIVVDAPHAAAVNNGSRPHMPPLAPLIEWVKLRGMQGLGTDRQLKNSPGNTTASAARGVAGMLAKHARGGSSDIDAPRKVAMAIAMAIAKRGTKPHHFIERAMPEIRAILKEEIEGIRREKPTASDDKPLKLNEQVGRSYHYGKKGGVYYVSHTGRRTYVKSHKVKDVLDEGHHIHEYRKGR